MRNLHHVPVEKDKLDQIAGRFRKIRYVRQMIRRYLASGASKSAIARLAHERSGLRPQESEDDLMTLLIIEQDLNAGTGFPPLADRLKTWRKHLESTPKSN